jgi:hypothetical protein
MVVLKRKIWYNCPNQCSIVLGLIFYERRCIMKGKHNIGGTALAVGLFFLALHAMVIYEDAKAVIEDPNEANKPWEILKLVTDFTRYFG